MTVKKLLSLKEVPAIFYAVKTGNKSCVLSDADFRHRSMACGCPPYLLSTEVAILLHYAADFSQEMFLATLSSTGIGTRIAGTLTPSSFVLNTKYPYLYYFRSGKRYHGEIKGCIKKAREAYVIPLMDEDYVIKIKSLISMFTLNNTAKEKRPLWAINSITADEWISNAVRRAQLDGIEVSFKITANTLRRSFFIRMLTIGIHPDTLSSMFYSENVLPDFDEMRV